MKVIVYAAVALSLIVVLGTLGIGLFGFARGGEMNSRWGNRLMA